MIRWPFGRNRRLRAALDCLAVRSAAKDDLRRAQVRGDTRAQHEAAAALKAATTAQLRAEHRLGIWR